MRSIFTRILAREDVNFLLTNRLPRRLATQLLGWFSKIDNPLVCQAAIAVWKMFTDLDLSDSATTKFRSLHACFTRALVPGARPPDPRPDVLVSPCDAIVGACGRIDGERVYQIKGFPYTLRDLFGEAAPTSDFLDGRFITLRLTSSMYHRFHAPYDLTVDRVTYISGDTWNVNPIALKRVEKLFCKNERAVISARLEPSGHPILLVPVAAILVASIRLHFIDTVRHLREVAAADEVAWRVRRNQARKRARDAVHPIPCHSRMSKGQEMGWFEHGSTIIVFTPAGFDLIDGVREGARIKAGRAIMHIPPTSPHNESIDSSPVGAARLS
jgi:phosphatidylserine decarboxylase